MTATFLLVVLAESFGVHAGVTRSAATSPSPARLEVQARPAASPETSADPYIYQPGSRRDPFMSLRGTGEQVSTSRRADGLAGLLVHEISVRGIVHARGTAVAMVEGPGAKTYLVHAGAKLQDGTVKSISAEGLVIVQEVIDSRSNVTHLEVRKPIQSRAEATP